LGLFFPTEWKNKIHVPNHQPFVMVRLPVIMKQIISLNASLLELISHHILVGSIPTPLKNDEVTVSWDDEILPINMESHKISCFQTTNQP